MSRRRDRARGAARRTAARTARPVVPWVAVLAVAAVAALAVATLVMRSPHRARGTASGPATLPSSGSIARLGPDQAYQRAVALVNARKPGSSLPYFEHAMGLPGAPLQARLDYAVALHNAAIHGRSRHGLHELATRSSVERVALMRRSLAQLDTAQRMVATPSDRALVHASRAHRLVIWGMPWEALAEFRAAQAEDSSWSAVAEELASRLRHPEWPDPGSAVPGTDESRLERGDAAGR